MMSFTYEPFATPLRSMRAVVDEGSLMRSAVAVLVAPLEPGAVLRPIRGAVAVGVAVPVVGFAIRVGLLVVRPRILAAIVRARSDAVAIAHVIREIRRAPLARRIGIVGLLPL